MRTSLFKLTENEIFHKPFKNNDINFQKLNLTVTTEMKKKKFNRSRDPPIGERSWDPARAARASVLLGPPGAIGTVPMMEPSPNSPESGELVSLVIWRGSGQYAACGGSKNDMLIRKRYFHEKII